MHENLLLRVEIDKLQGDLERYKMLDVRKETKKKLKYIRSRSMPPSIQTTTNNTKSCEENHWEPSGREGLVEEQNFVHIRIDDIKNEAAHQLEELKLGTTATFKKGKEDEALDLIQISDNGSNESLESSSTELALRPSRTLSSPEISRSLYAQQ